jgi:penicillin-binding protein 2
MRRDTQRKGVFTRRALLVGAAQLTLFGVLGRRLYEMQIEDSARYDTLSDKNRVSARLVAPPRGRILDRFGTVVAGNTLNWRALILAEQAGDVDAVLDAFGRVVPFDDRDRGRVERELRVRRRFIPVIAREFLTWEEMARIEVNAPDLPGVLVDLGSTRNYPFGPALAHIVGYVAPPNEADVKDDAMLALPGIRVGRNGMEKAQEVPLRGKAGAVQMEVNAVGRVIRELDREEGTPGADLGLTLDADLQGKVLARLGDESASAVVLDARNGEVLAMGTNPSFDPSLFNSGVSEAQWIEWTRNRRAPLINKAAAGLYAPGSTFKMAVGMAGLESGAIRLGETLSCPGYIDVGDTRFHCWRKGGHGALDVRGGLQHSCDVFFYQVALKTGIDQIAAVAKRFGIGVDLGIELPGARRGLMPTREWRRSRGHPWQIGDTVSCGIGQGYIETTPLALATYCARIATGRAVQPHFTRTLGGAMQPGVQAADWPAMDVAERYLQVCRQGMWAVVNAPNGTAPIARLRLPGVQLAGKTGSTQVRRVSRAARESGHFKSENLPWEFRPHALFVCYAPYDEPRYAVSVVVEHGNAGAAAAAPIARDIMQDTLTRDPAGRAPPPQRVAATGGEGAAR